MSFLDSSPVTLDGIPLQISEDAFKISAITPVEDKAPWLARERVSTIRGDDDSLGFEMVNLIGQRIRVSYAGSAAITVPANNDALLDSLYKKVLRTSISVSGSVMNATDFASFRAKYLEAQKYWAKRSQLMEKLAEPDITHTTYQGLITALAALTTTAADMTLTAPLHTGTVLFAEGSSCSFSSFTSDVVSDFAFELVYDTPLA